jgi:hypothetical protein
MIITFVRIDFRKRKFCYETLVGSLKLECFLKIKEFGRFSKEFQKNQNWQFSKKLKEPPNTGNFSLTSITIMLYQLHSKLTSERPTICHCSAHQDLINFSNWLRHGLACMLTNKAIT